MKANRKLEVIYPARGESELTKMAAQLDADGFSAAANAYRDRIPAVKKATDAYSEAMSHLSELADASCRAANRFPNESSGDIGADRSTDRGRALADWLVEQGWTPPTHLTAMLVQEYTDA